ncbi:MAG: tRNA 4-thiouridine(8) synthase ThiI [Candidatus Omnitrophica bacterium]|nr:tRNA 4-thiouridine(8) synthase ThiI [Candidatus Omnitrophota bacterium]
MKAIALVSGGLDSVLAARVAQEQGIEVIPFHFSIPFCHRSKSDSGPGAGMNRLVRSSLHIPPVIKDISADFLSLVREPAHGFGSQMNPCIDCKILMLRKAKDEMPVVGAAFVITGEVLGQRPMSQYRDALKLIEKKSGLEGLVVRPLSAQLLDETIPEQKGWIARSALLNFNGRNRKPQFALAKRYNISGYPNPAGGCLLTDPAFSNRLKDLIMHGELSVENISLLKIGRHFRISDNARLAVGRNEEENRKLLSLAKGGDYLFMPSSVAGPTSLGRGVFSKDLAMRCAAITCRYCDLDGSLTAEIIWRRVAYGQEEIISIAPFAETDLAGLRI